MKNEDMKNVENIQPLSDDELEDVAGGGVKEIVAATTLAAMAMTGQTASAFGMARAMAEENSVHIEQAPEQEAYGMEYAGDMVDFIEAEEAVSLDVEDAPEEVTVALGDEAELMAISKAAPEPEEEAVAELPAEPVYEIGGQRVFKLSDLAFRVGIDVPVTDVAYMSDADAENFRLFADADGDLSIEFLRSFDAMELGFVTANEIVTAKLLNASIDEAAPAAEETPAEAETAAEAETEIEAQEADGENEDVVAELLEDDEAAETETIETHETGAASNGLTIIYEDENGNVFEPEAEEVPEEDVIAKGEERAQMMADMIEESIEEKQDEGIYAALDNTFATLAGNAMALANPDTGAIETEGNAIINMTYDALASHFDAEPEQLMGAIGAAAARADEAGYIQALGGDAALVSMAASNDSQSDADVMKYANAYFGSMLDAVSLEFPAFKPFVPLLKTLGSDIFSTGGDANAKVLNKLNDIEKQIDSIEASLERNTYNVVSLQSIGDKYSVVADKTDDIQEKIGNIVNNTALTDAQRIQQLADMTKDSEFRALESAMDGATKCFLSKVNDIFERQSLFEAAYARACESVMFSREAIDISMPYITRQYAVYCAAYGVMNQVYNAYEKVYGATSLTDTRKKMAQRLGGVDPSGKKVDGSVTEAIKDYCARDRYLFVDKGSCSIALDRAVAVWPVAGKLYSYFNEIKTIANQAKAIPVSKGQMEDICRYAASKGRNLFNFLFNDMQFAPVVDRNLKLGNDPAKIQIGLDNAYKFAFDFDSLTQTWDEGIQDIWFLNGQQSMPNKRSKRSDYKVADLINGKRVGIQKKDDEEMAYYDDYKDDYFFYSLEMYLLILQGR